MVHQKYNTGLFDQVIRCLLVIPFQESSLNEEAGRLFMENYQEYSSLARIYTELHAKPKKGNFSPNKLINENQMEKEENKFEKIEQSKITKKENIYSTNINSTILQNDIKKPSYEKKGNEDSSKNKHMDKKKWMKRL